MRRPNRPALAWALFVVLACLEVPAARAGDDPAIISRSVRAEWKQRETIAGTGLPAFATRVYISPDAMGDLFQGKDANNGESPWRAVRSWPRAAELCRASPSGCEVIYDGKDTWAIEDLQDGQGAKGFHVDYEGEYLGGSDDIAVWIHPLDAGDALDIDCGTAGNSYGFDIRSGNEDGTLLWGSTDALFEFGDQYSSAPSAESGWMVIENLQPSDCYYYSGGARGAVIAPTSDAGHFFDIVRVNDANKILLLNPILEGGSGRFDQAIAAHGGTVVVVNGLIVGVDDNVEFSSEEVIRGAVDAEFYLFNSAVVSTEPSPGIDPLIEMSTDAQLFLIDSAVAQGTSSFNTTTTIRLDDGLSFRTKLVSLGSLILGPRFGAGTAAIAIDSLDDVADAPELHLYATTIAEMAHVWRISGPRRTTQAKIHGRCLVIDENTTGSSPGATHTLFDFGYQGELSFAEMDFREVAFDSQDPGVRFARSSGLARESLLALHVQEEAWNGVPHCFLCDMGVGSVDVGGDAHGSSFIGTSQDLSESWAIPSDQLDGGVYESCGVGEFVTGQGTVPPLGVTIPAWFDGTERSAASVPGGSLGHTGGENYRKLGTGSQLLLALSLLASALVARRRASRG